MPNWSARLPQALTAMGQQPFKALRPDGWPEVAAGFMTPPMMAARDRLGRRHGPAAPATVSTPPPWCSSPWATWPRRCCIRSVGRRRTAVGGSGRSARLARIQPEITHAHDFVLSRRAFLIGCSVAASPLLTPVTFAAAPGDNRLVVIVLRGAMDGLDVVRPLGDRDYAALRPTLTADQTPRPTWTAFSRCTPPPRP